MSFFKKLGKKLKSHLKKHVFTFKGMANIATGGTYGMIDAAASGNLNATDYANLAYGAPHYLSETLVGEENARLVDTTATAVAGAVLSPFTGGASALGASALIAATTSMDNYQTEVDNTRAAKAAAKEAEAAANRGHTAYIEEANISVDTASNEAYRKKQARLAAGMADGRGGTSTTGTSLGGSSTLG